MKPAPRPAPVPPGARTAPERGDRAGRPAAPAATTPPRVVPQHGVVIHMG
ncbi:hypothetical protein [Microbacterium sp. BLY]|nr:hypothetical protein [Microbacterium sp. BLY]MBP3977276.1 hypothetical protein [Microbacterium sp. BLY]